MEKVDIPEVIEWAKQFLAQSENEITNEERKNSRNMPFWCKNLETRLCYQSCSMNHRKFAITRSWRIA